VVTQLSSELPDILMDERYIKQALLNLLKNAAGAMSEGGTITLKSHRSNKAGAEAVLEISDTGKGMSSEVMEKIFEPFFTTKDFGSGIGLTLVFKIVKEHGGDISVQSELGKGTTFTLSFPTVHASRRMIGAPPGDLLQPMGWRSEVEDAHVDKE